MKRIRELEVLDMSSDDLKKIIRLTGDRAKLDAKINESYVVYKNEEGKLVKEYHNGIREVIEEKNENHV